MTLPAPAGGGQDVVVHDGLVLHVDLGQHYTLLLLLLFLLPPQTLLTVQDSFGLDAVFIQFSISVRTHCAHQQGQCFLFSSQLHFQTFVLLLHLHHLFRNLVILCLFCEDWSGAVDYAAENRLLISKSAPSLLAHHNRPRVIDLPTVLNFLLCTLKSFFSFCCLLLCLTGLAGCRIAVFTEIQQRDVAYVGDIGDVSHTLLADGEERLDWWV